MAQGKTYKPTQKDRELVTNYTAVGIPQEDIALILKITPKTLRKHYADEIDQGGIKANAAVGGALYTMALSGDCPAATIFWHKTRRGWRERDADVQETKPIKIIFERGDTRKSQLVDIESDDETGTE